MRSFPLVSKTVTYFYGHFCIIAYILLISSCKFFKKCACVSTIHLRVMELERDGQVIPKSFLSISPPDDERIIENAAVHTNSSVDFRIYDGGSADDHTFFGQGRQGRQPEKILRWSDTRKAEQLPARLSEFSAIIFPFIGN